MKLRGVGTANQQKRVQQETACRYIYIYISICFSYYSMLPVYRPVTRGRVAPEGGEPINRNIPIRGVIIDL